MDGTNQPQQPQPLPQQQPAPQPQQPFGTPVGQPPMGTPYQMPPKKGLSKGALWGIIGGSIGLVLLIVGVILAVVFLGGPSKDDYVKAGEAVNSIVEAGHKIKSEVYELSSTQATSTSLKNATDTVKKSRDTINAKLDELGKMKAVTGDKEVKEKYDALAAKREKFNSVLDATVEFSEKWQPILRKFSRISSTPSISEISSMITEIEAIDAKDSAVADFKSALVNFLKATKEIAENRLNNQYDSSAWDRLNVAQNKYYDALKDMTSNMEKRAEEAEIKNEINALQDVLTRKITSKR